MKKVLPVLIVVFVFTLSSIPSYAININIDGQNVQFTEASGSPFIDQTNSTLVPFRQTMESFGCTVSWDPKYNVAIAKKDNVTVNVWIGSDFITRNGYQIPIDTAAVIKDNRTYLPIRAVLEAFGANVNWDSKTKTVVVFSEKDSAPVPVQEVRVSTAEEFVNAIGSYRKIILEPGVYDLSKIKHQNNSDHTAIWEDVSDGEELVIQNVRNLTIEGSETGKTELITSPRFAAIMMFKDSSSITIKNITAGHTPMKEYICEAGVLGFDGCSDIAISNSEFYGCGSVGLGIWYTTNLKCDNVNINHCSLRALDISESNNITFLNTKLQNHEAYSNILYADDSSNIEFENCDITNNNNFSWSLIELEGESSAIMNHCRITNNSENYDPNFGAAYFFRVVDILSGESGSLLIKNSTISGNRCDYLTDDEDAVTFENCTMKNNIWN